MRTLTVSLLMTGAWMLQSPNVALQQMQTMPSVSPQAYEANLTRLAIETAKDHDVVPIPLDADGSKTHGVLYDRFLLAQLQARARVVAGSPIDPASPPAGLMSMPPRMVVVAFPLTCEGKRNGPLDIGVTVNTGPMAGPVRKMGDAVRGAALKDLLPGAALPEGALGQVFANAPFLPGGMVTVAGQTPAGTSVQLTYADAACPGTSPTVSLPIGAQAARSVNRVSTLKLPADAAALPSPSAVRVSTILDLEGQVKFPTALAPPDGLEPAALAAVQQWRFEPFKVNGAPVPQSMVLTIMFTKDGLPPPPGTRVGGPPPVGPPVGVATLGAPANSGLTTSVTGAALTHETTSASVAGLTAETSKCPVSADDTYGFAPGNPVKTGDGGDQAAGPRREVTAAEREPCVVYRNHREPKAGRP